MNDSVVVYTALFGGYYPAIPPAPDLGCPAVALTDDPDLAAPGWQVEVAERWVDTDPRMQAKWFKLHPHELFPDHEASIWLDAGWQIVNPNFARECAAYLKDAPAVFYPHRWRTTVRAELAASTHPKFAGLPLAEQVESYFAQGFPDERGLLECTSLLRRHHEGEIVALDHAWWAECERWSHADQLSLPFLLWRLATPYAVFPFNLEGQPWFRLCYWRDD